MINQLYRATKAEMLKYKGTYATALATLAPLFISLMITVIYFIKARQIVKSGENGMSGMLDGSINASSTMLFTFYLILLTILIHQIEHRAHSLKDVFSYPVSYFSTYAGKWIVSFLLVGLSVFLYLIFSLIGFWIVEIRYPALFWFDGNVFFLFVRQVCYVMIASLMLMGIQFLIALRWSNVVVAFSTGVVGFISAIILVQGWKYVHFHPYALGTLTYMRTLGRVPFSLSHLMIYSLIGLMCLFTGGYFMWCKRRIV
ncbi:MAG TPA: ABC transporter permease [Bacteroidales bacterium]|nr:ABC transporter permease [Bacteroidales bacterium]